MNVLLWLLPLLPAGAGGLLLLLRRGRAVALTVAVLTLALALFAAVTRPAVTARLIFREGLAVDGLSAVMVIMVAAVGLAVLVFAMGGLREARFYGLMLIFLGAMLVTVTATDLVLLLMGWEVMGAMSYALIGYWWREPDRARSGAVAFLTTRTGDLGLYLAAGAAMAGGGGLELRGLPGAPWRDLVAAGIVLAALAKSAQLPFSFWLSRAMAGPSPVSALLHSASMVVAGAYLLLRVQPLLAATGWAAGVVAWAGGLTALLLGGVAVAQRGIKQLLAASTCAQIGFMVVAAGVPAVAGGVAQIVAHAAVKSLLFLGAGVWAGRRCPVVGVAFGVGAVALAGVPPLSLWVTKDLILGAVRDPGLYAVLLAAALLASVYSGKALVAIWRSGSCVREVTVWERAPMPVLALVAAGFGVVGLPGVFEAWGRLVGDPRAVAPSGGGAALSGGLAVVVVAAMVLVRRRTGVRWADHGGAPVVVRSADRGGVPVVVRGADRVVAFFGDWLFLERAAVAFVARPVMALARALARFDDRVLDAAVEAVPRVGMGAARIVRAWCETGIDGVVRTAATWISHLGTLARRPQTGQVHLYFAQAAVALIVLAVAFAVLG